MYETVRKYETEFKDTTDYSLNYKNNATYVSLAKPSEPELLECYIMMTKRYLYCFRIQEDCDEYPLTTDQPINTEDIISI